MRTVRCISLWQPWATALFLPELKPIETRHWSTPFQGTLAIHVAKMASREVVSFFNDKINDPVDTYPKAAFSEFGYHSFAQLPLGAIIGTVEMVDCIATANLPFHELEEELDKIGELDDKLRGQRQVANFNIFRHFMANQDDAWNEWVRCETWGNFQQERFGWCFKNPILLSKPIPYKGKQGFFNVELPE